ALQDLNLFLHGDSETGNLTTEHGTYEEQHVLATNVTDIPNVPIFLGEWVTAPIVYPMSIEGEVYFILFAKGDLQQVSFSAYLTVNGVEVSPEMTTEFQDLNESDPVFYWSSTVNITQPLELNNSDTIGFSLWLTHGDAEVIIPPPIGGSKNVTLLLGGTNTATFVTFYTNSMSIGSIEGRDDPSSGNMIVTATIKCSFGVDDFSYAAASTKSTYGNKFNKLSEEIIDEATVEVEWEWVYSVSDGGSYPVTVKAYDRNPNLWKRTEDVHITTPYTEVDFSIDESAISLSDDPVKNKNTTITANIKGTGRRWSAYQVDVEFYAGSELIEKVRTTISKSTTNKVSAVWTPEEEGKHPITVIIDPDNIIGETDEDNNEASRIVDVKKSSGGPGTPGFESFSVLSALAAVFIYETRRRRKK
ncbi:MAG: hypothetical protein JSW28_01645, partial [Thermoplasmata archaeon]